MLSVNTKLDSCWILLEVSALSLSHKNRTFNYKFITLQNPPNKQPNFRLHQVRIRLPALALKPRGDVTRSPKPGVSVAPQNGLMPSKKKKTFGFLQFLKSSEYCRKTTAADTTKCWIKGANPLLKYLPAFTVITETLILMIFV